MFQKLFDNELSLAKIFVTYGNILEMKQNKTKHVPSSMQLFLLPAGILILNVFTLT